MKLAIAYLALLLVLVIGGINERRLADCHPINPFLSSVSLASEDGRGPEEAREEAEIRDTAEELIEYYAQKFDVDQNLVACIVRRESSFNPFAVGDQGRALGLVQAHPYFWRAYRGRMGLSANLQLRADQAEAIKTLAYVLSAYGEKGGQNWSVYWKCKKEIKQ